MPLDMRVNTRSVFRQNISQGFHSSRLNYAIVYGSLAPKLLSFQAVPFAIFILLMNMSKHTKTCQIIEAKPTESRETPRILLF